jgi:hypothetical protein
MGGMFATAGSAAAASCSTVTITGPVVKALLVSSATVPVGGCVVFTNDAIAEVTVTVSGGFSASSASVGTLATSAPFTADTAGQDTVTVAGKTLALLNSSGSGTLTVTPAPAATKSPTTKPSHKPTGASHHPSTGASSHPSKSGGTTSKGGGTKAGGSKQSGTSGGKISTLSSVPAVTLPPFPHFPGREFTATRSVGSAPQIASQPAPVVPLSVVPTAAPAQQPTRVQLADVSSSVRSEHRALPVTIAILMLLAVSTAYGRTVLRRPLAVDNGPGRSAAL